MADAQNACAEDHAMKTKTPKIRYRVCKRCGMSAIVNADATLKMHTTGHAWRPNGWIDLKPAHCFGR